MTAVAIPAPSGLELLLGACVREGLRSNFFRWLRFRGYVTGELIEFQALEVPDGRMSNTRGAFAKTPEAALKLLDQADRNFRATGIYMVLNSLHPGVQSRGPANRWTDLKKGVSTTDRDITDRRALFIDCDVERPRGTSATDAQVVQAGEFASRVHEFLSGIVGTEALAYAHSGNGRQIYVALASIPETEELSQLVKGCLQALDRRFSTAGIKIDPTVCDAKRIAPAFGTWKRKGDADVPEYPHRQTGLVVPDAIKRIDMDGLRALLRATREGLPAEAQVEIDRAMGIRTAAPLRAVPSVARPSPTPEIGEAFRRANLVSIESVADWLGLMDHGRVQCPGCGETDGVDLMPTPNGLKCLHNRCSSKGAPGHGGFRTPIDLVMEVRNLDAKAAVAELAARFNFDGIPERPTGVRERASGIRPVGVPIGGQMPIEPPETTTPVDETNSREVWGWLSAAEVAEPLAPVSWLCNGLRLAPGAAVCFAGYGYSRKTLAAQALAFAVMAKRHAFGVFSVEQGLVVHLDYEQGRRLTSERYQRMARADGVTMAGLGNVLRLACLPPIYIDTDGVEDSLMRLCDGARLLVVDSLRAAAPSADESSSEVRRYIDVLTRISERTGATSIFIHHARKPQQEGSGGGARMAIRGSSAIFDACSSVFVFTGEKGAPTRVQHEKDRIIGTTLEDFGIDSQDVEIGSDPRGGLRVVHLNKEQLDREPERRRSDFDELIEKVLNAVRTHPNDSKNVLCAQMGVARSSFYAAFEKLETERRVINTGTSHKPLWQICTPT